MASLAPLAWRFGGGATVRHHFFRSGRAFASSAVQQSARPWTKRRILKYGFVGFGGVWFVNSGLHNLILDELKELDGSRAIEREKRAQEYEVRRVKEIKRLKGEARLWRLVEIVWVMLPIVMWYPIWLLAPETFWNWVSIRIDRCGPCFVKLAQWGATRRDLFSDAFCAALGRMHEDVDAPWADKIVSSKVKQTLNDNNVAIESIEARPHASGSMAEVFFGKMSDGSEVAIKCLRPGVRPLMESDLAWLLSIGEYSSKVEATKLLGLQKASEEFCEHVQMQCDFRTEATHLRRFLENFADARELSNLRFPKPLFDSEDILVLTKEKGIELSKVFRSVMIESSQQASSSSSSTSSGNGSVTHQDAVGARLGIPQDLSKRISNDCLALYMRMIFRDAFVHGDLHPGNIMLAIDEERLKVEEAYKGTLIGKLRNLLPTSLVGSSFELVVLDAGLAIPMPASKITDLRSLTIAIIYADFNRAAEILLDQSPDKAAVRDEKGFKDGIAKAFRDCRKQVWEDGFVQISDAVLECLRLVQHHNVELDTTLTWTLFGMLSVEGSARQLDHNCDCALACSRYILTIGSLWRELRTAGWHTSRQMIVEMVFNAFGQDYWEWRNRMGKSWFTDQAQS
eukprot:TRINITY_DN11721_c0_g1_i1.p1 TRINITY_DN11721_c0_g1~~TRINITY_DN11721_c0_g1_i1.p1  ORF type:complete len:626 (+),score=90.35 TRINITY_DN11721_c0_g1_i1:83-1960(+)